MTDGHHPECDQVREHYNRKTGELLCACGGPAEETIGELAERLPPNEWVNLPEYGIRVIKKWGPE